MQLYAGGLTGYTYGFSLFAPSTSYRVYNSNKSVNIIGSATLD
ncbi:hypothetical protein [Clostridium algoriphilum]|nr:hypothetical protein [Clostridium algoriphilum]